MQFTKSNAARFAILTIVTTVLGSCSSGSATRSRPPRPTIEPASVTAQTTATTANVSIPEQREEPALPLAIQEGAAAATSRSLYVVGGYDAARNSSAATLVFNGTAWTSGPSLPIAVNHPGAAALGDAVYVAGGFTPGGVTNRAFVLTPGTHNWRALSPMRRARGALALVAFGQRLYAVGGRDGVSQIAVPETYDPRTNAWTDVAAMPRPRNHLAGYVDGRHVCVAGGRTPGTSAAIDCFDPANGRWGQTGALTIATSGASATFLRGVTFVAGGEPSAETHLVDVVQRLSPNGSTTEPMLVPRHGTAFALYGGRLWMCGGATAPGYQAVATCTSLGG